MNIKNLFLLGLGVAFGGVLAYVALDSQPAASDKAQKNDKPLYWVAPMDPNYRRSEPGLSPMGMALVPVFEEGQAGSVKITAQVEHNIGVKQAPVSLRRLRNTIRAVGQVNYDEDRLLHVHARVEGWIEKLHVKAEGNRVEAGQPLYEIYSPQLVAAQEELVLALSRGNGALIAAAKARLRALSIGEAFVEMLTKTQEVQQRVTFYAPQSGVIHNLQIREGFFVSPDLTLLSIAQLDSVWVEVDVLTRAAAKVTSGAPVSMVLEYFPGRTWRGEVDYVYPSLDAMTRTLRLRLKFDNPEALLRPNMLAEVQIHELDELERMVIPRQAVIQTEAGARVMVALGEGRFRPQSILTGLSDPEYTEVLEGLGVGDQVVTSGQFLLDSESN